jgi:hypothetical protein
MTSTTSRYVPVSSRAVHWIAGLLGTSIVLLFAVFAIGEGPPAALLLNPQTWALLVMLTGFILVWWHDLAGGVTSLLGIGAFYLLNYLQVERFPGGPVFPLCFLPGVLAVIAWLMRRRTKPADR